MPSHVVIPIDQVNSLGLDHLAQCVGLRQERIQYASVDRSRCVDGNHDATYSLSDLVGQDHVATHVPTVRLAIGRQVTTSTQSRHEVTHLVFPLHLRCEHLTDSAVNIATQLASDQRTLAQG